MNSDQALNSASVSVVIPARNAARTLGRALRSIEYQSFPVTDVVVVDDNSDDDTAAVARREYDLEIRCVPGAGKGAAVARNIGARESSGAFIAFLDADDIWYPAKIEKQMSIISPGISLVGALFHYLTPAGRVLGTSERWKDQGRANAALRRAEHLPVPTSSFLVEREVFEELGGFNERFQRAHDFEFAVRLSQIGRVAWPPREPLVGYVMDAGSLTHEAYGDQFRAAEAVRAHIRAGGRAAPAASADPGRLSLRAFAQLTAGRHYRQAAVLVASGKYPAAVSHGIAAMLIDPAGSAKKAYWQRVGNRPLGPVPPDALRLFDSSAS